MLITGALAITSGHAPLRSDGTRITGRVGETLTLEEAQAAARCSGLAILSSLRAALGSLDRVLQVVRVSGMVCCTPDFTQHPAVVDGCSLLFREVFGEQAGVGARCSAGFTSLPGGIPVEIEAVFALHE